MLKLIHCADIHLGSRIAAKLPPEKSAERRRELRLTFSRMLRYAKENGICVILLSGDVFDSDRPSWEDKEFFYDEINSYPNISFLYLRGNHDISESYSHGDLKNLSVFSDEWESICFGDTVITGAELTSGNAERLYSSLSLDRQKKNIVMLHGAVAEASSDDCIDIRRLRDKGIDYLALGHYHSYKCTDIDNRGVAVYSGCLEGRGFDECGEKGFVVIEIDDSIKHTFVPFANRRICEMSVDVSGLDSVYDICAAVRNSCEWRREDMLRINLVGEISFDGDALDARVQERFCDDAYFVSVKDKTQRKIDASAFEGDTSLGGEFVRTVLACEEYSEDEKRRIIAYGLRALAGEEIVR